MLGVLLLGLNALASSIPNAEAQTETNLHFFIGGPNDGQYPFSTLVEGDDGNLYGTTSAGGKTNSQRRTCGTVFRISPSGTYTILYFFGTSPSDGWDPIGGLVKGTDGNFYGTTQRGGTNGIISGALGTVFRISPGGSFTNLYSFPGYPGDGHLPQGTLVQGSDGNFYGTTFGGGANGNGTVFRISTNGSEETVWTFLDWPGNGAYTVPGVVQGSDGDFYGTTVNGGTSGNCSGGCGTVFRISPGGSFTNLHSFDGYPNDGSNPYAGLIQGSDGNFYGTTRTGGTNDYGTVFRISPTGSETILYSFVGRPNDGAAPQAPLVQGSDGNFYGTTLYEGATGAGILFRISPSGSYTNLYSFEGPSGDGYQPQTAALVQGSDSSFYGTTPGGGYYGNVFKLTVPLCQPPWPINQITAVQLSGGDMIFNIPSIAGETYRLQFTTDLTYGIWSNVPSVSVTNSIGALLTLTNFGGALSPQGFYRFDITP